MVASGQSYEFVSDVTRIWRSVIDMSPVPRLCKRAYLLVLYYKPTVVFIVQELCESRGGRPGLSVLTSLLVSVDVKLY